MAKTALVFVSPPPPHHYASSGRPVVHHRPTSEGTAGDPMRFWTFSALNGVQGGSLGGGSRARTIHKRAKGRAVISRPFQGPALVVVGTQGAEETTLPSHLRRAVKLRPLDPKYLRRLLNTVHAELGAGLPLRGLVASSIYGPRSGLAAQLPLLTPAKRARPSFLPAFCPCAFAQQRAVAGYDGVGWRWRMRGVLGWASWLLGGKTQTTISAKITVIMDTNGVFLVFCSVYCTAPVPSSGRL